MAKSQEQIRGETFKDYDGVPDKVVRLPPPKHRHKHKTKPLKQCAKCGRVANDLTQHSLTGHHRAPFVWLCRHPCHDEVHNFGVKMKNKKKTIPTCEIQFPSETTEQIVNAYKQILNPELMEAEKLKQSFSTRVE